MTYCLGIVTQFGLVIAADSRTSAGVDYISTYQKLFDFSRPGERILLLCTSGNLSITQAVLNWIRQDLKSQEETNLYTLPTLHEVARYIGSKIRQIQDQDRQWLQRDGIDSQCSFLLGGQLQGEDPELHLIYTQGNCIQATPETPFLQIGETKYGKLILDRILRFDTELDAAAKCAMISILSTMKSNISVGPPIHLVLYAKDTFRIHHRLQLALGDPYLMGMNQRWQDCLKEAFDQMPDLEWDHPQNTPAAEVME